MRHETRSREQIEANAIDLELFRLAQRVDQFRDALPATARDMPDIVRLAQALWAGRHPFRARMHKNDRVATDDA